MRIENKQRIEEYGEVFTSESEVNAMLDLVYDETQRIDSRFFEPACGNGNFLIKILERKLDVVSRKYKSSQIEFERYAFQAVASLYGVDILQDNVEECRERLLNYSSEGYNEFFKKTAKEQFLPTIKFVLSRNVLWGDALTLKEPGSDNPLIFSEWSFIQGSLVQRADYTLFDLVAYQPFEKGTLFSDFGDEVIIPDPIRTFKAVHYLEISNGAPEQL